MSLSRIWSPMDLHFYTLLSPTDVSPLWDPGNCSADESNRRVTIPFQTFYKLLSGTLATVAPMSLTKELQLITKTLITKRVTTTFQKFIKFLNYWLLYNNNYLGFEQVNSLQLRGQYLLLTLHSMECLLNPLLFCSSYIFLICNFKPLIMSAYW